MPKVHIKWTDTLSPVISKRLTVSANIIWKRDRYFVPKRREGTSTKSQKDPWIWEGLFRNFGIKFTLLVRNNPEVRSSFSIIYDQIK